MGTLSIFNSFKIEFEKSAEKMWRKLSDQTRVIKVTLRSDPSYKRHITRILIVGLQHFDLRDVSTSFIFAN